MFWEWENEAWSALSNAHPVLENATRAPRHPLRLPVSWLKARTTSVVVHGHCFSGPFSRQWVNETVIQVQPLLSPETPIYSLIP